MAKMTPKKPDADPKKGEKKYFFTLAAPSDANEELLNADFNAIKDSRDIKIVITVAADGTITSYNHPSTGKDPADKRLKDESGDAPYDVGEIWDLATLTFIIYGKPKQPAQPAQGGQPAQPEKPETAEVGYWKTVGGSRIMVS